MLHFHALSHTSSVLLLWSVKRWKPQGGSPLEFSPFCNPLSLTPVASHNLMTKSWFCRELNKKLSDVVNQMAKKVKFIINSPHRSSARWTESRNTIKPAHVERTRGGDKERGFQKGRTLRGGRSPPLVVLLFCRSGICRCLERSQQPIEAF